MDPLDNEALVAEVTTGNFSDDPRLRARLATMMRRLLRDPSAGFPSLMPIDAELEGAYRFYSNVFVTPDAILEGHYAATRERCVQEKVVRVVHDTTEFSYRRDGKRQHMGDDRPYQGFFAHCSLAVAADDSRKPLGVVGLHTWVREKKPAKPAHSCWLKQIKATSEMLGPDVSAIHIADRGADDFKIYAENVATNTRFVIRASKERWTKSSDGDRVKLGEALAKTERVVEREARIGARRVESSAHRAKIHPARDPRQVTLHVSAIRTSLVRPSNYGVGTRRELAHLPESLEVNIVRVWEPEPPAGAEPIEWLLITNEPIATAENVLAVVDHYRARWIIEEYFKAVKTGCAFEKRQLQDYESLINALAVFMPIAYQMLLLRTVARVTPDAPASSVLTSDQIEVLP